MYLDESLSAMEKELLVECDYLNEAQNQRLFHSLINNDGLQSK